MFGITRCPIDFGASSRISGILLTELGDFITTEAGDFLMTEDGTPVNAAFRATEYATRITAAGGSPDATSLDAFEKVFQAAADIGKRISNGWMFGSKGGSVSKDLTINMVPTKPSLVPTGTLHADSTNGEAMLGLRVEDVGQGLVTDDSSGIFGYGTNHTVFIIGNVNGDTGAPFAAMYAPEIMHQGPVEIYYGNTGALQYIDRPSAVSTMAGSVAGGSATLREHLIDPLMLWISRTASNNFSLYHASGQTYGELAIATDPTDDAFKIGETIELSDIGIAAIVRVDGALTTEQAQTFFNELLDACKLNGLKSTLVVGNSNTIPSLIDPYVGWPKLLSRWGVYNDVIVGRWAEGARQLPYLAPTGYTLPGAPATTTAAKPVDVMAFMRANRIINDEQQNAAANLQPWSNFLHTHNAIVAYFQALNDDPVKAIMCTQIAWPAYQDLGLTTPADYAFVVANHAPLRTLSIAARAAILADFDNIETAIADNYALFNLGYDTGTDGDAADPLNDYPNGDETKMVDKAHYNEASHVDVFELYRDALISLG